MSLTKRYSPEHAPGDVATFGMSFEDVIPSGVGITTGALAVYTNVANPAASSDFTIGTVQVQGRVIYASLAGGVSGTDYQLRWSVAGTDGTQSTRTGLILCAQTS